MAMSARLPPGMLVPENDVLFSLLSSGVCEETVTPLMSVVPAAPADTLTTMSKLASPPAPAGSVAIEQVTVPPASPTFGMLQMNVGPLVCINETKVAPPGRVSVNDALVAASGPPLPRVMVNVTFDPTLADAGADLVTNRSADCAAAVAANRKLRKATLAPRAVTVILAVFPAGGAAAFHQLQTRCTRLFEAAQPGRITYATASFSGT